MISIPETRLSIRHQPNNEIARKTRLLARSTRADGNVTTLCGNQNA